MLKIKKRFKPRFKKFVNSKIIIPNKQKILSLKKKNGKDIYIIFHVLV